MNKKLLLGVLVSFLLAVTACTGLQPRHGSGWIAMTPFTSDEYGIRGVVPPGDWIEQGALVQQSFPGTMDELVSVLLAQTSLDKVPEPAGSYRGAALTWSLYAFETQVTEVGPETVRVDLALAEGGSASYLVAMVTLPDAYEENESLVKTVFLHAVYALAPLE